MSVPGTMSSIEPDDEATWQGRVFLTFDLDWANDQVLNDTIDLVEAADVPATWFVTHATAVLERLGRNPKFELGVHPNFNWLLAGDKRNGGDVQEVLENILEIVPDAKSIRCHSMTQSTGLLAAFASAGLTHDANHFIPACIGTGLRPWKLWNGMTRVPYFWEDDIFCAYQSLSQQPDIGEAATTAAGLKVFDLHPIHVFLNTERLERYESTREIHQDPNLLESYRYDGYGTRNRLLDLLSIMKSQYARLGSR